MLFYEKLDHWYLKSAVEFQHQPFVKKTLSGDLTKQLYITLLKEYYFFVKSAAPMYAHAAAHTDSRYPAAQEWFYQQAYHHFNHHKFIENDLNFFNEKNDLHTYTPSPEMNALHCFNFGFMECYPSIGVLGTPYVMTQISTSLALNVVDKVKSALKLDESDNGVSFFFAHGHLDKNQPEEIRELIKIITAPLDQDSVLLNAKTILYLYNGFLNSFINT